MLAIRMQRTGRKGTAMFRVVVQDSRQSPKSGRVVAQLGSYNPHSKVAEIDTKKIEFYLEHGAQPSDRIARLLKKEGVKLPSWVSLAADGQRTIRNPEKLRKNRPDEPEAPAEEATEEKVAEVTDDTAPAEAAETKTDTQDAPVDETADESAKTTEEASK